MGVGTNFNATKINPFFTKTKTMKLEQNNELLTISSLYGCTPEQFERKLMHYMYEYGIAMLDDNDVLVIDLVNDYGTNEYIIMNRLFSCYKDYTKEYFNRLKII